MDTRRSYYLACRRDDFAEAPADVHTLESYEILYATPANDNSLTRLRLSVRCVSRRLNAFFNDLGEGWIPFCRPRLLEAIHSQIG